eukprot:gene23635-9164_t
MEICANQWWCRRKEYSGDVRGLAQGARVSGWRTRAWRSVQTSGGVDGHYRAETCVASLQEQGCVVDELVHGSQRGPEVVSTGVHHSTPPPAVRACQSNNSSDLSIREYLPQSPAMSDSDYEVVSELAGDSAAQPQDTPASTFEQTRDTQHEASDHEVVSELAGNSAAQFQYTPASTSEQTRDTQHEASDPPQSSDAPLLLTAEPYVDPTSSSVYVSIRTSVGREVLREELSFESRYQSETADALFRRCSRLIAPGSVEGEIKLNEAQIWFPGSEAATMSINPEAETPVLQLMQSVPSGSTVVFVLCEGLRTTLSEASMVPKSKPMPRLAKAIITTVKWVFIFEVARFLGPKIVARFFGVVRHVYRKKSPEKESPETALDTLVDMLQGGARMEDLLVYDSSDVEYALEELDTELLCGGLEMDKADKDEVKDEIVPLIRKNIEDARTAKRLLKLKVQLGADEEVEVTRTKQFELSESSEGGEAFEQ